MKEQLSGHGADLSTPVRKEDIVRILKEIAFFMRLQGGVLLKAKRYHRAAEFVWAWPGELTGSQPIRDLTTLPQIGPVIGGVIAEIVATGASTLHRELRGDYPLSLVELGEIPGLTSKQIFLLYRRAGIRSLADLRRAVRNPQQLLSIPSFGKRNVPRLCTTLQTMSYNID